MRAPGGDVGLCEKGFAHVPCAAVVGPDGLRGVLEGFAVVI